MGLALVVKDVDLARDPSTGDGSRHTNDPEKESDQMFGGLGLNAQ